MRSNRIDRLGTAQVIMYLVIIRGRVGRWLVCEAWGERLPIWTTCIEGREDDGGGGARSLFVS